MMLDRDDLDAVMRGLGFARWGCARAEPLVPEHERLLHWVRGGRHAHLGFAGKRLDILSDPRHRSFLPPCRTVVMASLPFAHPEPPAGSLGALVARYARGFDYHDVAGRKIRAALRALRRILPRMRGRVFVDTAPIMEKAWASRAGLGWIGRSSLLVSPGLGTRAVLCGLAIEAEVEPDEPARDGCGDCRACIDACPVGAIGEDRTVDARACLSCLTIERRVPLSASAAPSLAGRLAFGCDTCQQACPHNAPSPASVPGDPAFQPLPFMRELSPAAFLALGDAEAGALLAPTALARTGLARFRENLLTSLSL